MSARDLFAVPRSGLPLHPQFEALASSSAHAKARSLMNALYARMGDPDGNFPADFQRDGFHSRLFELACFAYLESSGFTCRRSHRCPDFVADKGGDRVVIEATTANAPSELGGRRRDISVRAIEDWDAAILNEKVAREFPQRVASALWKKARRRYDDLPQCVGSPLVLAVAPFFEPGSVFFTDEALVQRLYVGADGQLAFFNQPEVAGVSAVLFCNQFTVPRFFRMAGVQPGTRCRRRGFAIEDVDVDGFVGSEYSYDVGDPAAPEETWSQGVTIFENPGAHLPLASGLLPSTSRFVSRDGAIFRELNGFHTLTSFMECGDDGGSGRQAP